MCDRDGGYSACDREGECEIVCEREGDGGIVCQRVCDWECERWRKIVCVRERDR